MKCKTRFTIFFFFLIQTLLAEDILEIDLKTQNPLSSIYVSRCQLDRCSFDSVYADALIQILFFDFNHSGRLQTDHNTLAKEQKVQNFDLSFWQKESVNYVLKPVINQTKFQAQLFFVENADHKIFPAIRLTGNLSSDRKRIHQLADAIHESIFGKKGIATTRLLYCVRKENPQNSHPKWLSEIWSCDYDGANSVQLTKENHYSVCPQFNPKSREHYLYVSYKSGQSKIYSGSMANTIGNLLIPLRGNQILPAISKQCDKIAFISDAAGRPDLFLQYFDQKGRAVGRALQLFSYPRATQASPSFSPNGKNIAFVSDKDGPPRIYILKIPEKTSQKRPIAHLITKKNRENTSPCWSPDGTKLAYSAKTEGIRQIWIYDFEKDEEWQLTVGSKHKENPCWAPDSLHIVYNTEDKDSSELYIVNLNQPKPIQITKGQGQNRFPAWEISSAD